MKYKLVTINEKDYKFRITTKAQKMIEEKLKMSVLDCLEKCVEADVFTVLIWGALQNPLNHGISLDDAYDIVDGLIDEGIIPSFEKRMFFVMELLKDAGFVNDSMIQQVEEEVKKEISKAKKK